MASIVCPSRHARACAIPTTNVEKKIVTLWIAAVRTITTTGLDGIVFVQVCYCVSVGHCNLFLEVVKRPGIVLEHAHSIPGDVCIYIQY